MNIRKENKDALNAIVTVEITKEDYEPKVQEVLKDYRKKARIDGFRPGHVPMGLINRLYYTPVKVEEINKLVSNSLIEYLRNENLRILGDPLPHKDEEKTIDFEKQESFEFSFDLGLSPEFDLPVLSKVKIPYYKITVEEKMIEERIEELKKHYGRFNDVPEIGESSMVRGNIAEADENGQIIEGGHKNEGTILSVDRIDDQEIRNLFIGKKQGDQILFDASKAFPKDSDRAGMLGVDPKQLSGIGNTFLFTVTEIKQYDPAPLDQQFFDQVFGEGTVSGEEEFRQKVKEDLEKSLEGEAEYRFTMDARETLISKTQIPLPEDFLKRWMFETNEGKISREEIEKDFDHFLNDLKWQLIVNKIARDNNFTVTEEEIKEQAKNLARNQYLRYGLANVPDQYVENLASDLLAREEERNRMERQVLEERIYGWIKNNAKIEDKEIDVEGFKKLFEKK
jgi:trigger factor